MIVRELDKDSAMISNRNLRHLGEIFSILYGKRQGRELAVSGTFKSTPQN
jgi:hypothetical protein